MIDWWGPILFEYYSVTEGFGAASIFSDEWLRKPGSVGRAADRACRMSSALTAAGTCRRAKPGNDLVRGRHAVRSTTATRARPRAAANERGWRTVGDVGYLDGDGYLYLTDRASNLIISGGVNIYPQEIENVLTMHPDVLDAAVLGVPDPEMGEQVKAVIQVNAGGGAEAGGADWRGCGGRVAGRTGRSPGRLLPRAPSRIQVPALV